VRDDDEIEHVDGQRIHCQIRAPSADAEAGLRRRRDGVPHSVVFHVDAEGVKSIPRERKRMTTAAHREVERTPWRRDARRQHRDPSADKRRR
jgi:hypothetical protein